MLISTPMFFIANLKSWKFGFTDVHWFPFRAETSRNHDTKDRANLPHCNIFRSNYTIPLPTSSVVTSVRLWAYHFVYQTARCKRLRQIPTRKKNQNMDITERDTKLPRLWILTAISLFTNLLDKSVLIHNFRLKKNWNLKLPRFWLGQETFIKPHRL